MNNYGTKVVFHLFYYSNEINFVYKIVILRLIPFYQKILCSESQEISSDGIGYSSRLLI